MFDFWLYSYGGAFFGSVSFGYFLLRFGLPDIRGLPQQIKLGLSGFAGVLIFLISAVISYLFLTPMFLYFLMPLLTFLAIVGITLKNLFFASKVVKVAVPIVKINPSPKLKQEVKKEVPSKKKVRNPLINSIITSVKSKKSKLKQEVKKEVLSKEGVSKRLVNFITPSVKSKKLKEEVKPVIKDINEEEVKPVTQHISEDVSSVEIKVKPEEVKPKIKMEVQPEERINPEVKAEVSNESPYARHYNQRNKVKQEVAKPAGLGNKKELSRKERYLRRRGMLVEQVKSDLTKPKELKGESAPLPILPDEDVNLEFGEGLDLSDLDSVDSLSDLGSLEGLSDDDSLSNLEGLGDLDDSTLDNLGGLSVEQEIKKEKGMSCPTCGAKNVKIIYCPNCGKGFCSNCSLKVQRKGDLIIYQCPNCKKEVIVKAEK